MRHIASRALVTVALLALMAIIACNKGAGTPGATPSAGGTGAPTGANGRPPIASPRPQPSPTPLPPQARPVPLTTSAATEPGSYLLDLRTGALSRVSRLSEGLWSPDGAAIAFDHCCDGAGYIDILDLETGETTRVPSGDARDLAWAPDSIHLAYVPMDRNLAAIGVYVVDRDGYNPHAAIKDAGAGEPRWLDDRRIAYSKGNQGDIPSFFVVDLSKPGTSKRLNPVDPPDGQDPRIVFGFPSSDGLWVVYYEGTYHSDLGQTLAWNSRTGELRVLMASLALGEFAPGAHTVRLFLPDPDRTGLSRNQVFDLDRGTTAKPLLGVKSHWSADGTRLVYETYPCQDGAAIGPEGLFSSRPDGSDVRAISNEASEVAYGYAVSPKEALVAYTAVITGPTPSWRLHVRTLDGAPRLDLSPALQPKVQAGAWSPDGRYLLFSLGEGRGVCG